MDDPWSHEEPDLAFQDDVFAVDLGLPTETDCGLLSWNPSALPYPLVAADPFFASQGSLLEATPVTPVGPERSALASAPAAVDGVTGVEAHQQLGPTTLNDLTGGSGRHAPTVPDVVPPQAAASAPAYFGTRSQACTSSTTTSTATSGATSRTPRAPASPSLMAVSTSQSSQSLHSSHVSPAPPIHMEQGRCVVSLQDFCWINEDHFVRVLVPVAAVECLPPGCVKSVFTHNSFELEIRQLTEGVVYRLAVNSLYGDVQPDKCWHDVLINKVIIHLTKITDGPSDGPDTKIFTWFSLRL